MAETPLLDFEKETTAIHKLLESRQSNTLTYCHLCMCELHSEPTRAFAFWISRKFGIDHSVITQIIYDEFYSI